MKKLWKPVIAGAATLVMLSACGSGPSADKYEGDWYGKTLDGKVDVTLEDDTFTIDHELRGERTFAFDETDKGEEGDETYYKWESDGDENGTDEGTYWLVFEGDDEDNATLIYQNGNEEDYEDMQGEEFLLLNKDDYPDDELEL